MRRMILFLLGCLLLTGCSEGLIRIEVLGAGAAVTPAPSLTTTPPETATSSPTTTPSPTPTATPTPTAQPSPVPAKTSSSPVKAVREARPPTILYFRANVAEAGPGETITLEWQSAGAVSAFLYRLSPSGQLYDPPWQVKPCDVFYYVVEPGERNLATFYLVVVDEAKRDAGATLSVKLRCPDNWFFSPAPDECPAAPPIHSAAAEQHFERGTMIWVQASDQIIVLYADGGYSPRYQFFADEWDEGEPDRDPALEPPVGRQQPIRGFGLVWRQYPDVRARLGWALDQELGFTTAVQHTARFKYNETYLRALDGSVWHLLPEHSGWEKITAGY